MITAAMMPSITPSAIRISLSAGFVSVSLRHGASINPAAGGCTALSGEFVTE